MKAITEVLMKKNAKAFSGSPTKFSMTSDYCEIPEDDVDYIIIYPTGYIEFFTEEGLDELIKYLHGLLDKDDVNTAEIEDSIVTYEELRDIKSDKFEMISGPGYHKGVLRETIGKKLKNK